MSNVGMFGKVALVTGAAQGLGSAIAKCFCEAGAAVVVVDIADEVGVASVESLTRQGHKAQYIHCDARRMEEVRAAVSETTSAFGGVDVLVNNAGISGSKEPITRLGEGEWTTILDVNLNAVFRFCSVAMDVIAGRGGGSVINISSVHHMTSSWGASAYAASKGGIVSLSRQLAIEWGPKNIRVNSISPGAIDATMTQAAIARDPAFGEILRHMNALGRLGTAIEVAQTAVFLASPGASYITGEDILVDGGMTKMSRPFEA